MQNKKQKDNELARIANSLVQWGRVAVVVYEDDQTVKAVLPKFLMNADPVMLSITLLGNGSCRIQDDGTFVSQIPYEEDWDAFGSGEDPAWEKVVADLRKRVRRYGLFYKADEEIVNKKCSLPQMLDTVKAFYSMVYDYSVEQPFFDNMPPLHPTPGELKRTAQIAELLKMKAAEAGEELVIGRDIDENGYPYLVIEGDFLQYEDGTPFCVLGEFRNSEFYFFDDEILFSEKTRYALGGMHNPHAYELLLRDICASSLDQYFDVSGVGFCERSALVNLDDLYPTFEGFVAHLKEADEYVLAAMKDFFGSEEKLNDFVEEAKKNGAPLLSPEELYDAAHYYGSDQIEEGEDAGFEDDFDQFSLKKMVPHKNSIN